MLFSLIQLLICAPISLIYIILFFKLKKQFKAEKTNTKNFIKHLIHKFRFKILIHYLIFIFAITGVAAFIKVSTIDRLGLFKPKPGYSQRKAYYFILTPILPLIFRFRYELERFIQESIIKILIKKFGKFKHIETAAIIIEYLIAGLLLLLIIVLARYFHQNSNLK